MPSARRTVGRLMAAIAVGLGLAPGATPGQEPVVVHRDTITFAPARLAVTAFERDGVLLEPLGRSPRIAVFLSDSAGEAWRQRTFDQLAASGEETTPLRPMWSKEFQRASIRTATGAWLGYAEREDRPGEAELQLVLYRPVFDAVTIIPLSPPEAQRLLARLGTAFAASHREAPDGACIVAPSARDPGFFPPPAGQMWHQNGEILMGFEVSPEGRADPATIVTLFSTERALEAPTRRFIARAAYEPARGPAGPCRMRVLQPLQFQRQGPAAWETIRKERIRRTP